MSKLSNSIMRSIQGGKTGDTASETQIEKAFDQADQRNSLNGLGYPEVSHESEGKDRIDSSVNGPSLKPQKVKPAVKISNSKVLGIAALMISLTSTALAGFVWIKQRKMDHELTARAESVDQAFAGLNQQFEDVSVKLGKTEKTVTKSSGQLTELSGMHSDLNNLNMDLDDAQKDIRDIQMRLEADAQKSEFQQKRILELEGDLQKARSAAVKTISHAQAPRPKPVARTITASTIEGATIQSIDHWGAQSYVMLQEPLGSWIPLTTGDQYRGWRLISSTDSEAVFSKKSQTRTITMQE